MLLIRSPIQAPAYYYPSANGLHQYPPDYSSSQVQVPQNPQVAAPPPHMVQTQLMVGAGVGTPQRGASHHSVTMVQNGQGVVTGHTNGHLSHHQTVTSPPQHGVMSPSLTSGRPIFTLLFPKYLIVFIKLL